MNHGLFFLIGASLAWMFLALVYRSAETRNANIYALTASLGLTSLIANIAMAIALGGYAGAARPTVLWGLFTGFFGFAAIPLLMAAVTRGGLGATWTVTQLSFALASVLTLFYPGAPIQRSGYAGLLLSVVAVVLLGLDKSNTQPGQPGTQKSAGRPFLWLFLALSALTMNALGSYGMTLGLHAADNGNFVHTLGFITSMAAMITLSGLTGTVITRKKGNVAAGLKLGVGAGICSAVGMHGSLAALKFVPGFVMYPVTNGGSMLLVALISLLFFGERAGHAGRLGLAAGIAGIVLLGVGG